MYKKKCLINLFQLSTFQCVVSSLSQCWLLALLLGTKKLSLKLSKHFLPIYAKSHKSSLLPLCTAETETN